MRPFTYHHAESPADAVRAAAQPAPATLRAAPICSI